VVIGLDEQLRRYAESVSEPGAIGPDPHEPAALDDPVSPIVGRRRRWATAAAIVLCIVVVAGLVVRRDSADLDVTSVDQPSVVTDPTVATDSTDVIGETEGSAPDSATHRPEVGVVERLETATTTTTPAADQDEFCAAVEAFRDSGLTNSSGAVSADALPYFDRILASAPADQRPSVEIVRAWIEQGSPMPMAAEVAEAQLLSTSDWMTRCASRSVAGSEATPPGSP